MHFYVMDVRPESTDADFIDKWPKSEWDRSTSCPTFLATVAFDASEEGNGSAGLVLNPSGKNGWGSRRRSMTPIRRTEL
jgi:hypothetical protein